jgi:NAD(P)-dependent dehydrogenase (short-subunit alcohol dehydrogenase family)
MNKVNDRPLNGQRAVVTGGASGIGRAAAHLLSVYGADVLVIDRNTAEEAASEAQAAGGRLRWKQFDVSNSSAIPGMIQDDISKHGPIHILVNCAGIAGAWEVLKTTEEEWDRIYAINLKAPFLLTREVVAAMISAGVKGRIVNVTSSSAFRARDTSSSYSSSKAAMVQLTRTCAAQFGPHGINVNAVAPGVTLTPLALSAMGEDFAAKVSDGSGLHNLLGRPSMPEDVAEGIVFLTLPASRQITGHTLHISAGAIV